MKITNVEAIIVKQKEIELIGDGSQDTVVIKVHTDEGITGIGEVDSSPYVVKAIVEAGTSHMVCMGLRDIVVGEDPFDVEKIWYKMYNLANYYGRRSVAIHAMSGIDMAIWDILGKKLGVPVHKLLGGAFRDKIPAYCSVLMPDNEDEIKRIADTYLPQGYTGIKFGWGALGQSDKRDLELVRACRRAMGDDPQLMIDIGMVWKDVKTAIRLCKEFEKENVYWVEEPFTPDDLEAYKRLTHSVDMRISAGEQVGTMFEFNDLIAGCGIDIIQPDISRCGGITIAKKVIDMSNLHKIPIIPHAFKTGILMSASLQIIAAAPNALWLEYCCQETVLSKNLVKRHFAIDDKGMVNIPNKPGLGIELDEEVLNFYRVDV